MVDIDLNTGLVSIKLSPGSSASTHQFNEAIEKNGFTHKDATIVALGRVTGTAAAPFFEVAGTQDRSARQPAATPLDLATFIGKTVTVAGTLPRQANASARHASLHDDCGGSMTSTTLAAAPERRGKRAALLNYFSLFSSFSTLICCALPSVLVLLGLGITVASLLSASPWLVSLSRHKTSTFSIAGTLIGASFVATYFIAPRFQNGEVCIADDPTTCGEVNK